MLRIDTLRSPQSLFVDLSHPSPNVVRAYTVISKVADEILSFQVNVEGSDVALAEKLSAMGEFYKEDLLRPCEYQVD